MHRHLASRMLLWGLQINQKLGLPIPKSIVESDVVVGWSDSDAERGSTFTFSLPLSKERRP